MVEFYVLLIKNKITPNQFYLLYSMSKDQSTIGINIHLEMRSLTQEGWIIGKVLQTKAKALINTVEEFFTDKKVKNDKDILQSEWEKRITEYLEIFPKIKLPTGKAARSDRRNVSDCFKWFFSNYKFTWEEIILATKMYVNDYERRNYKFMRTAQYFIRKQEADKKFNSDLADWCSNSDLEEELTHFIEKII